MDFIHDPTLQFIISVTIAIAAVVAAIIIARKQQGRKEIAYEIISNTSLVNISHAVKDKIQIHFEGKIINDLCLVIIRIWNSGNTPITYHDYIEPITINFKRQGEVLGFDVTETEPDDLHPHLEQVNNGIILKPLLLNSGDKIKMYILLSNFDNAINVSARIIGVKKVLETSTVMKKALFSDLKFFVIFGLLISISISSLTYMIMALIAYHGHLNIPPQLEMFGNIIEGSICFIIGIALSLFLVRKGKYFRRLRKRKLSSN